MNEIKTLTKEQQDLVESNMKLVNKVIYDKYKDLVFTKFEPEDLEQAGYIGLCKAALYFDENKKVKFSTYAYRTIVFEISRFITPDIEEAKHTTSPYDELQCYKNENAKDTQVDGMDYFGDKENTEESFLNDEIYKMLQNLLDGDELTEVKKNYVRAFISYVFFGYSAEEAGVKYGGVKGIGRMYVKRGRELLAKRREFVNLWEESKAG